MSSTSGSSERKSGRRRWGRIVGTGVVAFVVAGVLASHEFPSVTSGPKTSTELLASLFSAPVAMPADAAAYALARVKKDAAIAFIQLLDAPADVKTRVTALIRGESFDRVTVPFVFYLYDLYGGAATAPSAAVADLAYAEAAPSTPAPSPGVAATVVQHPLAVRRYGGMVLRLFDALFLQTKPGASSDLPLPDRYDPAAYQHVKAVVRDVAAELLAPPSDARQEGQSEYLVMLDETMRDDQKLSAFVEFFTDLVRELADGWLQAFVTREMRKDARTAWMEDLMRRNRYFEIADYARSQAERKLAIHLVVDGLQGKLLEGLVQLANGDRESPGALYVAELVRQHQTAVFSPATYGSTMPPPLGNDVVALATSAPVMPGYLENFRKYFFADTAPSVIVNVATVDTPSISVRNLPIAYSGHGVAGPTGTGIPNFSYLDRETGRGWYFWGSDMLYMRDIFGNREDRIPQGRRREGSGATTLMERLWRYNTVSAMATIDTGALEKVSSEVALGVGELRRNVIEKILVEKFRERAAMERDLNERRRWLIAHRRLSDSVLASLVTSPFVLATFREHARFIAAHEDEGLPDYLLWYNPWPDHFAHGKGPYSDDILGFAGEYDRLDFYVGKMLDAYASVPVVSGPGPTYADKALFGIVSDHGLVYTPQVVSTDERLFGAMRAEGIDIKYLKLTHDEGGLPAIHGRLQIKPTRPYDAVVGSTAGGSYIIDLFSNAASDAEAREWARHPDYHDLRGLRLIGGQTIDFIDQLVRHLGDTLDFAVVRERGPKPGSDGWPEVTAADGTRRVVQAAVRIVTRDRGEARIYRLATGDGTRDHRPRYRYEVLGSRDPLDLAAAVRPFLLPKGGPTVENARASIERAVASPDGLDDQSWQQLLSYTVRPDVIHQLSHLYDSDRAGTVNVFPAAHVGMNSGVPGRHAGEAFGEKNGVQLYRGPGLRHAVVQTARHGSLPVTIYEWLTSEDLSDPSAGTASQFGYASLMRESAFDAIRR